MLDSRQSAAAQRRGPGICLGGLLWLAWLLCLAPGAWAEVLVTDPPRPLGLHLSVFASATPISLQAAIEARQAGAFRPSQQAVPRLGIDAPPHWLHLTLNNPQQQPLRRTLQLGIGWIDRVDVHLLGEGRVIGQWHAGDGDVRRLQATPGLGYLLPLELPPGRSELYLLAHTPDPLLLPMQLLDEPALQQAQTATHYSYGLLYGFLLALIAYNLMLYAGLKDRSHLDYSLFLGAFILLNLAYTGHAGAWFWPDSMTLKRYSIPALMIAAAWLGLRFARHFLQLDSHAPGLARQISRGASATLALLLLGILLDWHAAVIWLAFAAVLIYTLLMVLLGLLSLRHGQVAARYFLAATLCGMLGTALTDLAVWGLIPFTTLSYRAVDIGILAEAILLALALAYQMRLHQKARSRAENLARIDPLTGLLNRRALQELGNPLWHQATRQRQPLSLIMLDLDHFKRINDEYGHAMGDSSLVATAGLLAQQCRKGDLLARWGGEEFLLLLPQTPLQDALGLAERLRQAIANVTLEHPAGRLELSASLGVASQEQQTDLEQLIKTADARLYAAKHAGRNRVCGAGQERAQAPA